MRKKLLFVFFLGFSFFLGLGNVSAKTKLAIDYNSHEHFNYFYEQHNGTPFYNLMLDRNTFFNSVNVSNTGIDASVPRENAYCYIFYYSDIDTYINSNSNNADLSQSKYVVFCSTYSGNFTFNSTGNTYTISQSNYGDGITTFFDEDANILGSYTSSSSVASNLNGRVRIKLKNDIVYELKGNDEEYADDFSYFLSFSLSKNTNSQSWFHSNDKYILTDLYVDEEHYVLDDTDNYSSFIAKWRDFWSLFTGVDDLVSAVDAGLTYFKTNAIQDNTKFPGLWTILDYNKDLAIPSGFSTATMGNSNDYLLFFPKNINSALNRYFYTSTNEFVDYDKVKVWLNTYDLVDHKAPYDESKLAEFTYKGVNTISKINVNTYLHKLDKDYDVTNYIVQFTYNSFKYEANIYYNPNAYTMCRYKIFNSDGSTNTQGCSYIDANGDTVSLSHEDVYNILSQNDSTGASVNVLDSAKKQCAVAEEYSELYEYDDDCNIIGTNQGGFLPNFFEALSNITKWLSGFASIIGVIFSYFALMFNTLPEDVRYCFLFGFVGGTIVLLYKLIRG